MAVCRFGAGAEHSSGTGAKQGLAGLLLRNLVDMAIIWIYIYSEEDGFWIMVSYSKFRNSNPVGAPLPSQDEEEIMVEDNQATPASQDPSAWFQMSAEAARPGLVRACHRKLLA